MDTHGRRCHGNKTDKIDYFYSIEHKGISLMARCSSRYNIM